MRGLETKLKNRLTLNSGINLRQKNKDNEERETSLNFLSINDQKQNNEGLLFTLRDTEARPLKIRKLVIFEDNFR